jgi:hypothetical protein
MSEQRCFGHRRSCPYSKCKSKSARDAIRVVSITPQLAIIAPENQTSNDAASCSTFGSTTGTRMAFFCAFVVSRRRRGFKSLAVLQTASLLHQNRFISRSLWISCATRLVQVDILCWNIVPLLGLHRHSIDPHS